MKHLLAIVVILAMVIGCRKEPCPPPEPEPIYCGTVWSSVRSYSTGACYAVCFDESGEQINLQIPWDEFGTLRRGDWYCAPIWSGQNMNPPTP